jgi:hypothetical protein
MWGSGCLNWAAARRGGLWVEPSVDEDVEDGDEEVVGEVVGEVVDPPELPVVDERSLRPAPVHAETATSIAVALSTTGRTCVARVIPPGLPSRAAHRPLSKSGRRT